MQPTLPSNASPVLPEAPSTGGTSSRRHDLDWLRVILFGLLIWFHLGVFTFWLFPDEEAPLSVLFVVDVMHQWRLAALFLISGMGTAFAFRRRDVKTFLNERLVRLGIPLLFATYVLLGGLVAPLETLWLMLVPFPGSNAMPYAHLWFLRNLLLYSVFLAPLFAYVRKNPESGPVRAARWTVDAGRGLALITVPALISPLRRSSPSHGITARWACGGNFLIISS